MIEPLSGLRTICYEVERALARLKPGKDAFHRVPDFAQDEWDAVERVLTITGGGFVGGLDGMTVDTLLISLASIVFCLYLFERRDCDRNLSRALHFCKDE